MRDWTLAHGIEVLGTRVHTSAIAAATYGVFILYPSVVVQERGCTCDRFTCGDAAADGALVSLIGLRAFCDTGTNPPNSHSHATASAVGPRYLQLGRGAHPCLPEIWGQRNLSLAVLRRKYNAGLCQGAFAACSSNTAWYGSHSLAAPT